MINLEEEMHRQGELTVPVAEAIRIAKRYAAEQVEAAMKEAREDAILLEELKAAGVDNWSYYDDAQEAANRRIEEEQNHDQ